MFPLFKALLVLLSNIFGRFAYSEFAFLGRQPTAINPTLYDSKADLIIQLDDMTFNDTIFCKHSSSSSDFDDDHCTAYVVEASFDSIKRDGMIAEFEKIISVVKKVPTKFYYSNNN